MEPIGSKMVRKCHPETSLLMPFQNGYKINHYTTTIHRFPLGAAVSRSAYNENGAFGGVIFCYFFDTFASALKTRKRHTYITLGGFWPPKTSLFWINFRILFGTLSRPPSGGAF